MSALVQFFFETFSTFKLDFMFFGVNGIQFVQIID